MAVAINDLEERGRQFRFAIDENFQRQKRERSLKPFPFINNMRYFIVTYIAVGRSFDEAETILITAGFNAHMRPASNIVGTREDKYDVIATLLLARGFPSITLLVVAMRPNPQATIPLSTKCSQISLSSIREENTAGRRGACRVAVDAGLRLDRSPKSAGIFLSQAAMLVNEHDRNPL